MRGKVIVLAAVLALVVPTAVSAKIGASHGGSAPAARSVLVPKAKSRAPVATSQRAVQHDGTCGGADTFAV
jgi:hypothetical protein